MINSEIIMEPEGEKAPTYPKLVIGSLGVIVMQLGPASAGAFDGFVVYEGDATSTALGYFGTAWAPASFNDFTGTITLSNKG